MYSYSRDDVEINSAYSQDHFNPSNVQDDYYQTTVQNQNSLLQPQHNYQQYYQPQQQHVQQYYYPQQQHIQQYYQPQQQQNFQPQYYQQSVLQQQQLQSQYEQPQLKDQYQQQQQQQYEQAQVVQYQETRQIQMPQQQYYQQPPQYQETNIVQYQQNSQQEFYMPKQPQPLNRQVQFQLPQAQYPQTILENDSIQQSAQSSVNKRKTNLELTCEVCSGMVNVTFNHGAKTCEACKKFFIRSLKRIIINCKNNKNECMITEKDRSCESCRLNKCNAVGMRHGKIAGKIIFISSNKIK